MLTRLACVCFVLYRRTREAEYKKRFLSRKKVATWLQQNRLENEREKDIEKDLDKMDDHGSRLILFEERFGRGFCLVLKQSIARDLFVLQNSCVSDFC